MGFCQPKHAPPGGNLSKHQSTPGLTASATLVSTDLLPLPGTESALLGDEVGTAAPSVASGGAVMPTRCSDARVGDRSDLQPIIIKITSACNGYPDWSIVDPGTIIAN